MARVGSWKREEIAGGMHGVYYNEVVVSTPIAAALTGLWKRTAVSDSADMGCRMGGISVGGTTLFSQLDLYGFSNDGDGCLSMRRCSRSTLR